MKKLLLVLLLLFSVVTLRAQTDSNDVSIAPETTAVRPPPTHVRKPTPLHTSDSAALLLKDTVHNSTPVDSILKPAVDSAPILVVAPVVVAPIKKPLDTFYRKLLDNPFFRTRQKPVYFIVSPRQRVYKDEIFYFMTGLLIFLAFIKVVFGKYFKNIFRLFFQPTFRQKQTREQIQQGKLPSMLLNLFFVLSVSAYATFLITDYNVVSYNFWLVLLYSVGGLLILYIGKFVFLTFSGWVFDVRSATEAYIFSVYLINKILGVLLVPFLLLIAFSLPVVASVAITCSCVLIIGLFLYRYIVSYAPVSREVRVSPLHFLFYILAFEVVPVLLIYKTLIIYLHKSL